MCGLWWISIVGTIHTRANLCSASVWRFYNRFVDRVDIRHLVSDHTVESVPLDVIRTKRVGVTPLHIATFAVNDQL